MSDRKQPNYVPLICGLARENRQRFRPGTVHEVQVAHDSWCLMLTGCGPCSCNPEVTLIDRTDKAQ